MKHPKNITLDKSIIEFVEKMAQEENRNFSNMVEEIIKRYLKFDPLDIISKQYISSMAKKIDKDILEY